MLGNPLMATGQASESRQKHIFGVGVGGFILSCRLLLQSASASDLIGPICWQVQLCPIIFDLLELIMTFLLTPWSC